MHVLYMYVYIYTHTHIYLSIYLSIYIYIYIFIYIYIHIHVSYIIPYLPAPPQVVTWTKSPLCHCWAGPPLDGKRYGKFQLVRLAKLNKLRDGCWTTRKLPDFENPETPRPQIRILREFPSETCQWLQHFGRWGIAWRGCCCRSRAPHTYIKYNTIYIYIYTCMNKYTYTYIYESVYKYIHMYMYMYIYTCMCISTYMYTYIYISLDK